MLKITKVETFRLEPPQPKTRTAPRRVGQNKLSNRAYPIHFYPEFPRVHGNIPGEPSPEIWVKITAEDGSFGLGSCKWGQVVDPLIHSHYAPLLIGRDALSTEFLHDLMWRSSMRFGAHGLSAIARSAIDLALWDIKGKALGVPVYSLLGGPAREAIDIYVTGDDLDYSMELGFKRFKLSNTVHYREGTEGINRLEERVAKAREIVGPDADLMINPVMSFNVEYAIRVMERLKPYHLRWFEEPLIPQDVSGLAQLKRAVPGVPIATGEDHHCRQDFLDMIRDRSVDILQPDIRFCGGLTEVLRIYTLGEAAGIQTIPHAGSHDMFGLHFALAMPESPIAEYWMGADPGVPLEEMVRYPGTPYPQNGQIRLSDEPGFGFDELAGHLVAWTN